MDLSDEVSDIASMASDYDNFDDNLVKLENISSVLNETSGELAKIFS